MECDLEAVRRAPRDGGRIALIVRRPAVGEREELEEAVLDADVGLVGDSWSERGEPDISEQVTLMSTHAAALVAGDRPRWGLAGDQFYVDMDISHANLPAGTQLALGAAVIEISERPHLGCKKFAARFGIEMTRLVNSQVGRDLRLRGVNARVVEGGLVRVGDRVTKRS